MRNPVRYPVQNAFPRMSSMPPEQASDAVLGNAMYPRWRMDEDCSAAGQFLATRLPASPQAAVVLGSGLGTFVDAIEPA
ncbi:MAG: hypothetical protein KDA90_12820, partial [Planctomycetaceae bacterium]|nr:hypothetical protein [Planctomycetaceae bacterium]